MWQSICIYSLRSAFQWDVGAAAKRTSSTPATLFFSARRRLTALVTAASASFVIVSYLAAPVRSTRTWVLSR